MIHSTHRFHGRSSLRFVYQHGRMVRAGSLTVRAAANARTQTWRAAVVVSRKVSKSAVVRNRIRRRIFEILRRHSTRIARPYDVVVSVSDEHLAVIEQAALEQQLVRLLQRAQVLTVSEKSTSEHDILEEKETV